MKKYILLALGIFVVGCETSQVPTPEIKHTWIDMGTTVSQTVEDGWITGKATVVTTKGSFESTGQYINPFIVGESVKIRDDSEWAYVGTKTMRLYKN